MNAILDILRKGKAALHRAQQRRDLVKILSEPSIGIDPLDPDVWHRSLEDPTTFYKEAVRFYHNCLSPEIVQHREYFKLEHRSFGEDAFHVMWYALFRAFRPASFLEIGVYRGQTLSLAALLMQHLGIVGEAAGISPFSSSGDSVSNYLNSINFYKDTLAHHAHFNLPAPTLTQAFSQEDIGIAAIRSQRWDCIYIDGNHDYEVARQDWEHCKEQLTDGGLIVLDDASRDGHYRPPAFAFPGHPGPTRIATEIAPSEFVEILRVGHNRVFRKRSL